MDKRSEAGETSGARLEMAEEPLSRRSSSSVSLAATWSITSSGMPIDRTSLWLITRTLPDQKWYDVSEARAVLKGANIARWGGQAKHIDRAEKNVRTPLAWLAAWEREAGAATGVERPGISARGNQRRLAEGIADSASARDRVKSGQHIRLGRAITCLTSGLAFGRNRNC